MTYYPDLSEYEYLGPEPGVLNIGWLGSSMPFPSGDVAPEFLRALVRSAGEKHNVLRGLHRCDFCDLESGPGVYVDDCGTVRYWDRSVDTYPVWLGTGEIRVIGTNGVAYAAPTLVIHYVLDHDYLPPQEFVDAVLREFSDDAGERP